MSDALLFDFATPVDVCDEKADMAGELPLLLVGLNHRTAPVEIRERMSVGGGRLVEAVQAVARAAAVNGAAVLSTCNRTEVVVTSSSEDALTGVIDWLAEVSGFSSERLRGFLYILRGGDVVEHLYRVTSGIDSMIIGEPQIAGQVRKAFLASQEAGVSDGLLHRLFENAMRVGKKVRTETGIGDHAVSVPYAAVELARKIFGEMSGLRALLLGAGEVGELVARHLASHGVQQIFVANKTHERAVELAERFGGSAVRFSAFENHLPECDIVIASTSAPHYVVAVDQVRRAVERRP
ncbi:MAG TPA: glutamyl-tRNA reductase, partial [Thermoanaerobaculia bacterium]|nr:glutamyl-tRNA reductase [Thermoanaerobaculia bacterium]